MGETHGDFSQPSSEAVLNEEADLEGTVQHTQRELVASPFKPEVDGPYVKDCPPQESPFGEEAKTVDKQLVVEELTKLVE